MRRFLFALTFGLCSVLISAQPIEAQSIGTFRWQLSHFCNVLTANISAEGFESFSVTGWDDRCGAPSRDALYGAFFFNPGFDPAGNNVGGGLTVVSAGGAVQHIDVLINEFTLFGTWSSSDGTSGQLIPQ
jgi:hypothetical protein